MRPPNVDRRPGGRPAVRWRGRDPLLWGALALQVAVCLPGMASRPLWLDEAYSAVTARGTLVQIRDALLRDNGPPLHYLLLHSWRELAGESPLALRLLSLGCVLGTTILIHRLGTRLFDLRVARTAVLLWAMNPLVIFYAREVRMYGLLVLFGAAFASALWAPDEPWSWRRCLLFAVSLSGLVYTHNVGWLVAGAGLIAASALAPRTVLHPAPVAAGVLTIGAYVPWAPILAQQVADAGRVTWWMAYYWSPWNPVLSVASFVPLGRVPPFTDLSGLPSPWWCLPVALWIAPLALGALGGGPGRRHGRFLAAWIVLGLAAPAISSGLWRPFYVPGRIDFPLLPAFLLLCAAGLWRMRASVRAGLLAVMLATSAAAIVGSWRRPPERLESEWTDILRAEVRPGDVVVCGPLTLPQARYTLGDSDLTFLSVPSALQDQPAIFERSWYRAHLDLEADARGVARSAAQALPSGSRIWVIAASFMQEVNDPLLDELARTGHRPTRRSSSPRMGLQHLRWPIELLVLERSQD